MHRPSNETESGVATKTDAANREGNIAYRSTSCRTCPIGQDSRGDAFTVSRLLCFLGFQVCEKKGENQRKAGQRPDAPLAVPCLTVQSFGRESSFEKISRVLLSLN
ncbi:hypothetical protein RRG08_007223 [Elysia crispata]|uniref:Uncharacterized protein n=1 Tax=Elysia crispata TaxID=231223 RepID=A0AAE0Z4B4_9GAST|nr:hypothetical protein RRG08_007223 [Elysia crispata]